MFCTLCCMLQQHNSNASVFKMTLATLFLWLRSVFMLLSLNEREREHPTSVCVVRSQMLTIRTGQVMLRDRRMVTVSHRKDGRTQTEQNNQHALLFPNNICLQQKVWNSVCCILQRQHCIIHCKWENEGSGVRSEDVSLRWNNTCHSAHREHSSANTVHTHQCSVTTCFESNGEYFVQSWIMLWGLLFCAAESQTVSVCFMNLQPSA